MIQPLEATEARHSDDTAKYDMELVCTVCNERLCDIEHGDTLMVLVEVVDQHHKEHHAT